MGINNMKNKVIGTILFLIGLSCVFIQGPSLLYAVIGGSISGLGLILLIK